MKTLLPADPLPCFKSREDAGCRLARRLARFAGSPQALVVAIPKRSVPVAAEVARSLELPFDVLLVEKLVVPHQGRLQIIGALACGGVRVLNYDKIDRLQLNPEQVREAILKASLDLARRDRFYRGQQPARPVADQCVILVDDGTTPGATLRDAIHLLRRHNAEHVIVATPVAERHAAWDLRLEADELVTLAEPTRAAHVARSAPWFEKWSLMTPSGIRGLVAHADIR